MGRPAVGACHIAFDGVVKANYIMGWMKFDGPTRLAVRVRLAFSAAASGSLPLPARRFAVAVCLLSSTALTPAHAASPNQWTGTISTDWADAGNWSSGSVPRLNVDAVEIDVTRQSVVETAGASANQIIVGKDNSGTLLVRSGQLLNISEASASSLVVGQNGGSHGFVGISGVGSQITAGGIVNIGGHGTGILEVTNAGQLIGGDEIEVGNFGVGSLNIQSGGRVSSTKANIGFQSNGSGIKGNGTVTIDGARSNWTASSNFTVGAGGNGSLAITNGGSISAQNGFLGGDVTGVGNASVDGNSSTWTNNNGLTVGNLGTGTLTISNGGQVAATTAFLAKSPGSTGTINIGAAPNAAAAAAGTLQVPALTFGNGTGTLNFNHTGDAYEFTPQVSGGGRSRWWRARRS